MYIIGSEDDNTGIYGTQIWTVDSTKMRILLVLILLFVGCSESYSDLRDEQEMLVQKRLMLDMELTTTRFENMLKGNPEKEAKIEKEIKEVDERLKAVYEKIRAM